MAVDTENKRRSIAGYGWPGAVVYPEPDGDIDNGPDRQHIAGLYAGITPAVPAAPEVAAVAGRRGAAKPLIIQVLPYEWGEEYKRELEDDWAVALAAAELLLH